MSILQKGFFFPQIKSKSGSHKKFKQPKNGLKPEEILRVKTQPIDYLLQRQRQNNQYSIDRLNPSQFDLSDSRFRFHKKTKFLKEEDMFKIKQDMKKERKRIDVVKMIEQKKSIQELLNIYDEKRKQLKNFINYNGNSYRQNIIANYNIQDQKKFNRLNNNIVIKRKLNKSKNLMTEMSQPVHEQVIRNKKRNKRSLLMVNNTNKFNRSELSQKISSHLGIKKSLSRECQKVSEKKSQQNLFKQTKQKTQFFSKLTSIGAWKIQKTQTHYFQ